MLRWMVPLDNTNTKTIGWRYFSKELDPREQGDASSVGVEKIDFIGQTKMKGLMKIVRDSLVTMKRKYRKGQLLSIKWRI